MGIKLSNNATARLSGSIGASATSLAVDDATNFPPLGAGDWFPAVIVDAAANREIVKVTARTGAVFSITRAQEGTIARAFNSGARIDLRLTAGAIQSLFSELVDAAPTTLDTLNELAAALGDDPNFAATMASQLGLKANANDIDAALALKQDLASRGILSGFRNKLLNGAGQLIQRGSATIAAGSSAYVFDRWLVTNNTNQSVTVSPNQLSLGAGFGPGGERITMRHAFASAPTTGTLRIEQRIEYVTSIKSGDWILTSWMKGPSGTETLAAEIVQNFGTGGSPSSPVTTPMTFAGNSPTKIYDASTNRRCWGVTVPSLSGKLLGTAGNDYLAVAMVLTPRQAGNYDVTWCSFVEGDASNDASNETDPYSTHGPVGDIILRRYFQYVKYNSWFYATTAQTLKWDKGIYPMRATPTVGSIMNDPSTSQSGANNGTAICEAIGNDTVRLTLPSGGAGNCYALGYMFPLSAEL